MLKNSQSHQEKPLSAAQQINDFKSEIFKSIEQINSLQKRADDRAKRIAVLLNKIPTENSPKLT